MTEKRFKLDGKALADVYCWEIEDKENEDLTYGDVVVLLNTLHEENEQLQARNDRQAKQLDNLYRLIEEKDWRTLTDIMDDFKKAEEQLQREWRIYE